MANSVTETLLGAAVLVTAAGFTFYASQSAGLGSGGDGRYELVAKFTSVEGVSTGTDVRMAGVKIGTVSDLTLNAETYQAEVLLSLRDDIQVPDDSEVVIASEGLLGGSFVQLSPGGSEFMLADGDEVLYTQSSVSLLDLMVRFATGSGE
ncbi:MAG: outer membrane lipid asymmetry maintenance protein MlaD [Pseudomonadota bacterium]